MNEILRLHAAREDEGERLDRFLARRSGLPRTRVQALLRAGHVRAGERVVLKPSEPVEAGLRYALELAEEPAAPVPEAELAVLHEDAWLVALDKPAGMLVHGLGAERGATLAARAQARFGPLPSLDELERELARAGALAEDEDEDASEPEPERAPAQRPARPDAPRREPERDRRPGIVHRLDRDTSGVIVLGRTPEALLALKRQFAARTVEKLYLALVEGEPRFESDWIEAPLGRPPNRRDRQAVLPLEQGGRDAATFYEVRERFEGFALLACRPRTGRTHQIRVHLAHAGLPLVADAVYRPRGRPAVALPAGAPALARHALHAQALALDHPADGRRLRFEAPLAADLAAVVEFLRARR